MKGKGQIKMSEDNISIFASIIPDEGLNRKAFRVGLLFLTTTRNPISVVKPDGLKIRGERCLIIRIITSNSRTL